MAVQAATITPRFVELEVAGIPAPQGSKTRMPNGAMLEAASKTGRAKHKAWRTAVMTAAFEAAHQHGTLDGPLHVEAYFSFPMPKSRPARARKAGRWPHSVKPDIDKVLRCTLDGLTAGGLIHDDSRVCRVWMSADEVAEGTGAYISVREVQA